MSESPFFFFFLNSVYSNAYSNVSISIYLWNTYYLYICILVNLNKKHNYIFVTLMTLCNPHSKPKQGNILSFFLRCINQICSCPQDEYHLLCVLLMRVCMCVCIR